MFTSEALRASVQDYRSPSTTEEERLDILWSWIDNGIPNQFAALRMADEIDKASGNL